MHPLSSIVLVAALGLAAPQAFAQHDAHHAQPAARTATPAPAQRFATDATLREEMQGIRSAVTGLEHYTHGHIGEEQAVQLAGQIQAGVNTIVANCKLPPDADAALHTIIVPLMQNAGALKQDPKNLASIKPMQEAMAAYAQQFDDPGVNAAE